MTRLMLLLVAAALVACGGASSNQVNVGGRISYLTLEGGVWTIRADDGVTYEPRSLAVEFKKDTFRSSRPWSSAPTLVRSTWSALWWTS